MANRDTPIKREMDAVGQLFSSPLNKSEVDVEEEGTSQEEDVLSLDMSDEQLKKKAKKWKSRWGDYWPNIKKRIDGNVKMWLGKHEGELQDNVIFEALETFLPMAGRQVPTPLVIGPNNDEGYSAADALQKMLIYQADVQKMKVKNKELLRNWCLKLLGVMKIGWDYDADDIKLQIIDPKNIILDPNVGFDVCEYKGEYIGHKKKETAKTLAKRFEDKKSIIKEKANGKMGTTVTYTEWWTDKYLFYTLEDEVLGKFKNPHWNYDGKEIVMDKFGNEHERDVRGSNHFNKPKMPFIFLSIFNLDDQPHDKTSLIEQVKSLQKTLNTRLNQVDKNADDMNNGWVFSNKYSQEEARAALQALRNGGGIIAPDEIIGDSVQRVSSPPLPNFIYEDMLDKRNEIKNVFGVRGSTAQGIVSERTVQGKIEIKGQDIDRSVGITDYLEQFTDYVFNWMVQMMYVYYDREHEAALLGDEKAAEYATLQRETLFGMNMRVSVKEGSMIPKDPLTKRNEAIDLWGAGASDPLTLYQEIDHPNPKEAAKRTIMYNSDPQQYMMENGLIEQEPQPPQQPQAQPQQMQQQPAAQDQGLGMLQALAQQQ